MPRDGAVQRNNALPGELGRDTLKSAGLGARLGYGKTVSLRLDVAQILRPSASRETNSQRVNASLAVIF